MTDEAEELQNRIAALETERERLTAAVPKAPTKRQSKERRDVSRDLAFEEKRVAKLEARLAPLVAREQGEEALSSPVTALGRATERLVRRLLSERERLTLSWFVAGGFVLVAAAFAAVAAFRGSDDVRWVETTCETLQRVDSDGDGYTVTIPALRPHWRSDAGCGERCWVMEPEAARRAVLCDEPASLKATRWEQVGFAGRFAVAAALWGAALGVLLGIRPRPE